jgi:hypothetical protein
MLKMFLLIVSHFFTLSIIVFQAEIIRLSENYVRALSRENSDIVDGPYAGRFTAYGLYYMLEDNKWSLRIRLFIFG